MCPLRHGNSSTSLTSSLNTSLHNSPQSASEMIHSNRPLASSTSSSSSSLPSSSSSSTSTSSTSTSSSSSRQIRCLLSSLKPPSKFCVPRPAKLPHLFSFNHLLFNSPARVNSLIIILVTTVAYWPSLNAELVFDDQPAIIDNSDVKGCTTIYHLFTNDYWGRSMTDTYSHKSYRPLTVLTFRLNYFIHGTRPFGYHVTNLILHIIVCLLFYRLANLWSKKESLLAALIFASHPIHTDAVTSVVGRAELLSAIFFLTSLIVNLTPCQKRVTTTVSTNNNNSYNINNNSITSAATSNGSSNNSGTNNNNSSNNNCSSLVNNNNNNNHSKVAISSGSGNGGVEGGWSKSHFGTSCFLSRHKLLVTLILAWLGFLCKEQSLSVLVFCALNQLVSCTRINQSCSRMVQSTYVHQAQHQLLLGSKKRSRSSSSTCFGDRVAFVSSLKFLAAFVAALLFRLVISGGSLSPTFNRFDNPASIEPPKTQLLTYAYLSAFNFWLLIFPFNLSCDWTHKSLPLVTQVFSVHFGVTVIFFTLLTVTSIKLLRSVYRCRSESSLQTLQALAILVVPFIPASNLFFRTGFVVAERVLYLPSVGFVLLLMLGLKSLSGRSLLSARMVRVASLVMVMCLAVKTYHRSCEWHDEISLFSSGLKVNPVNIKLLNNMGRLEEKRANFDAAVKYYNKALALEDKSLRSYLNLGNLYSRLSKFDEAEAVYRKAKSLVEVEFFHQKRTSVLHKTALLRLLQLLSRDPSVDRMEETKKIQKLAQILTSAEAANGVLSTHQMNVKV